MTHRQNDEDLRAALQKLRDTDARRAPDFGSVWNAARRRAAPASPAVSLHPAAALVALALLIAGYALVRRPADHPAKDSLDGASLTEWRAPTDVFLETPGRRWLKSPPRLGETYLPVSSEPLKEE